MTDKIKASKVEPIPTDAAEGLGRRPSMGPRELAVYRQDRREAAQFRIRAERDSASRPWRMEADPGRWRSSRTSMRDTVTFAELGRLHEHDMFDDDDVEVVLQRSKPGPTHPVTPARIAARLLLARLFDGRPDVLDLVRSGAPVVTIDVAEPDLLERVVATWKDVLFPPRTRVMKTDRPGKREDYDAICLTMTKPHPAKDKSDWEKEALSGLALALPFIAISPEAESHLPSAVLKAAPVRLKLPRLDARTISAIIRIVTGSRCPASLDDETVRLLSVTDLTIGIRFDRTPKECISQLERLASLKRESKTSRDITLDDLHSMSDAVAWARSTIKDLILWQRGMPWSQIDAGAALEGPPGCGKTTLPIAMCRSAAEAGVKLELASCSYSQFQGAGDGHLGHFLRELANFFASARSKPRPVLVFIDEVDSFADRSKVRHSHADYVTACVNAFIAECDGIGNSRDGTVSNREGLILLGASNDLSRCDPAILRSGRLNRVIRIGVPDLDELERMYRFRLGGRLATEDLQEICLLSVGCVGADVERIVKDAMRRARHASRDLQLSDLRHAVAPDDEHDHTSRWRVAVHEAGHILLDILNFGSPETVFATVRHGRGARRHDGADGAYLVRRHLFRLSPPPGDARRRAYRRASPLRRTFSRRRRAAGLGPASAHQDRHGDGGLARPGRSRTAAVSGVSRRNRRSSHVSACPPGRLRGDQEGFGKLRGEAGRAPSDPGGNRPHPASRPPHRWRRRRRHARAPEQDLPMNTPAAVVGSGIDTEGMVAALEATGEFRVLRRLRTVQSRCPPPGCFRRGLFVDVETTGLESDVDTVIELAMVPFGYTVDGDVVWIGDEFAALRDPGRPIPGQISRLTGITDAAVAGKAIAVADVDALVGSADLIVSHNAEFDRGFCEIIWPVFRGKPWACSLREIDWAGEGFEGAKLGHLAAAFGFFFSGHRAAEDCLAGIEILGRRLPSSGRTVLSALLASARRPSIRIFAEKAPFKTKQVLKTRGYRWHPGSPSRPRCWYVDLPEDRLDGEIAFLRTEIGILFGSSIPTIRLTAYERYSSRAGISTRTPT